MVNYRMEVNSWLSRSVKVVEKSGIFTESVRQYYFVLSFRVAGRDQSPGVSVRVDTANNSSWVRKTRLGSQVASQLGSRFEERCGYGQAQCRYRALGPARVTPIETCQMTRCRLSSWKVHFKVWTCFKTNLICVGTSSLSGGDHLIGMLYSWLV